MVDYKLMNRNELADYVWKFWLAWGIPPECDLEDEEIYLEIYENLGHFNGIEQELEYIKEEFEVGFEENSLEYQNLNKVYNYVNWYKNEFKECE